MCGNQLYSSNINTLTASLKINRQLLISVVVLGVAKFKSGDLIQVVGDSDVQLLVLFVGDSKYFVRYYDGNEAVSLIDSTDRHYEVVK